MRRKIAWWLGRLSYKVHPGPITEDQILRSIKQPPSGQDSAGCTCPDSLWNMYAPLVSRYRRERGPYHLSQCPLASVAKA